MVLSRTRETTITSGEKRRTHGLIQPEIYYYAQTLFISDRATFRLINSDLRTIRTGLVFVFIVVKMPKMCRHVIYRVFLSLKELSTHAEVLHDRNQFQKCFKSTSDKVVLIYFSFFFNN